MDLSTIKSRLDNQFYRRVKAVEFDVNHISINALKFHQPKSNIVRSASIITDLCLEIIGNRDAVDVPAIYQQLLEKYRERGGDEKADGPGTSEAASTSTYENQKSSADDNSFSPRPVWFSQSSAIAVAPAQPTSSVPAQSGIVFLRTSVRCAIGCFVSK